MSNGVRAGMMVIRNRANRVNSLIAGSGSPGSARANPGLPLPAIKENATHVGLLLLLMLSLSTSVARATDPATTTADTTVPTVNKWQYTLFNPVPVDQMRGMDVDRPDKTNTPHTVDAGHLTIETGLVDYTFDHDRYYTPDSRIETAGFGLFNFRLGVLNNLEVNLTTSPEQWLRSTDNTTHQSMRQNGISDTTVGATLNLWGNDGSDDAVWSTSLGIQPELKIPTARQSIGNGHAEFTFGLPFVMNLPAGFHLGMQPTVGWQRNTTNTGDVTGWQNTIAVDRVFFGKFDPYIEYWAYASTERHVIAPQTLDVGLTVAITDNLVWDAAVNFGLNRASTQLECTTGFSVRF